MKPELEALLKAYDAFRQCPEGPEASRLHAIYEALVGGIRPDRQHEQRSFGERCEKSSSALGASQSAAGLSPETGF